MQNLLSDQNDLWARPEGSDAVFLEKRTIQNAFFVEHPIFSNIFIFIDNKHNSYARPKFIFDFFSRKNLLLSTKFLRISFFFTRRASYHFTATLNNINCYALKWYEAGRLTKQKISGQIWSKVPMLLKWPLNWSYFRLIFYNYWRNCFFV